MTKTCTEVKVYQRSWTGMSGSTIWCMCPKYPLFQVSAMGSSEHRQRMPVVFY